MKLLEGNNIAREKWGSFLVSNAYASPFQSPGFLDFFRSVYGPKAIKAYALEEGNNIKALCLVTLQRESGLKGPFSRRAIIYGGPLLSGDEAFVWRRLLEAIQKGLRGKAIYVEVRNFHDYGSVFPAYKEEGWEYLPYTNVQISLEGKSMENVLAGMKYSRRREIRLSRTLGADCREAGSEEEVKELYKILHQLYRERVKLPLPAFAYFHQLFHSDIGKAMVVTHKGKVIGGAFCIFLEGQAVYTQYYCGLRGYHRKIFPTHLSVAGVMEFGIERKLKWVDLMGAGLKGEDYGVRKYKLGFGGQFVEHGRFIKVLNPALFQVGKLGLSLLQKIT